MAAAGAVEVKKELTTAGGIFEVARKQDVDDLGEVVEGFKGYITARGMSEATATEYGKKFQSNFHKYMKSLASMATPAYLEWMKDEGMKDKGGKAGLKHFIDYWPSHSGDGAAKQENVKKEDIKDEIKEEATEVKQELLEPTAKKEKKDKKEKKETRRRNAPTMPRARMARMARTGSGENALRTQVAHRF